MSMTPQEIKREIERVDSHIQFIHNTEPEHQRRRKLALLRERKQSLQNKLGGLR
jgi:hypothetical protein